jgi:hypothetical protein
MFSVDIITLIYLEILPLSLTNVFIDIRKILWYLPRNNPPHFRREVKKWLNNYFPGTMIGLGSQKTWRPRSHNLNILHRFLGKYTSKAVCGTKMKDCSHFDSGILVAEKRHRQLIQLVVVKDSNQCFSRAILRAGGSDRCCTCCTLVSCSADFLP